MRARTVFNLDQHNWTMTSKIKSICSATLAVIALCWIVVARADSVQQSSVNGTANASLEKEHKTLFLHATSHSFELAQFDEKGQTRTVLVEGELFRRLEVTDDVGAKGDETGRVRLTIRPIESGGRFGAISATREVPGDEIELDSPAGVTVITYGCCQEDSAEAQLSLASLKTLYIRSGAAPLTTYTILGKPALGRVIAVYRAMTAADEAVLGKDSSAVAMITVEGEDVVLQRMRVHLHSDNPREAVLAWSTELGWKTASGALDNHTVIDPAKPTKPIFTWKIGEQQTIELPLVNDRLDAAAAKHPAGLALEALPP